MLAKRLAKLEQRLNPSEPKINVHIINPSRKGFDYFGKPIPPRAPGARVIHVSLQRSQALN